MASLSGHVRETTPVTQSARRRLRSEATEVKLIWQMGLSENSVPLHPMVNDHYPY